MRRTLFHLGIKLNRRLKGYTMATARTVPKLTLRGLRARAPHLSPFVPAGDYDAMGLEQVEYRFYGRSEAAELLLIVNVASGEQFHVSPKLFWEFSESY